MTTDPILTESELYGEGLCSQQRIGRAFIWDDDWTVFGDQDSKFGSPFAKQFAVQFQRRPKRERYWSDGAPARRYGPMRLPPSPPPWGRKEL